MAGRVRQPIDVQALEQYLGQHVPEIKAPLDVKQFGFGQSNPTYQLTATDKKRYVMRKKPPGKLLSKAAHKVEREYRIIAALGPTDVPVPKAYCLCEDASVIGTPFYLMEFLDGRIFEDPALPEIPAEGRAGLWRAAVQTLARFHRVDVRGVGLETFGKSDGFYDRQLATWKAICTAQSKAVDVDTQEPVGQIPHFDEMLAFFADKKLQPRHRATLVHGDYKLDNMVFHKAEERVIGILDWEMSTVGHPLSDLANLLMPFYTQSASAYNPKAAAFLPGATPGLPTPDMILEWYKETAGWDPAPEMHWALAFSVFRSSAILQGIAARYAMRQASSAEAQRYAQGFKPLGELAWTFVEQEIVKARNGVVAAKL
ncbi:putative aminoglycoside phosphotransferase [Rosellinia necatrix]|uniref:Putative aminoglycoside phosphotransferase n=1 Tax=Rosellinia necatrix TaxID=77044 RepID=A0A1S7UNZ2_ROSNE|nr:putative aminoglycoside phosphotransferase [Rosellinia necatrix]